MKILINTFGTRGDIQPFIALAQGLTTAGHIAVICTVEGFRSFIEEHDVAYAHMDNGMYELMNAQEGKEVLEGKGNAFALYKQYGPLIRRALDDEWAAAQALEPDLILHHPKSLGSAHIAEKLNIPLVLALPLPMYTPTRAYPMPVFANNVRLGGWVNRLTYSLLRMANVMYGGLTNDFRVNVLGLRPQSRFTNPLHLWNGDPLPILYPYSPHVLPVPPDYPSHVHVTGYWFLDQTGEWQPPDDLLRFQESGAPPVYVGFGSMSGTKGKERGEIVVDALMRAKQRGLLISGWGGLQAADLPSEILMMNDVPHDWLFPHMAAVVHHGGAGTTAAGLRAGKPTIICPFIADQPFWGKVVHELGVGPEPIPQKQLDATTLASAITTTLNNPEMKQRAALLGEKIRAEDGVGCAIKVLEDIYSQRH
jgi:sterol 3beta-glucosyltransferase